MPKAEKPELLRWFYRQTFGRPFQIKDVLEQGAVEVLGKSQEDAEAYAEANATAFWIYLLKHENLNKNRGLSGCIDVVDDVAKTLSWFEVGVVGKSKNSAQMRGLARIRHRPALLRMIDALNDRQYEAVGCVISKLGGASETSLNPGRSDGGIDFFARVPSPGRCHLFGGGIHPLRIVAQCKKYKTPVQVDKVDAFITTINKVKHRGEKKIEARIPIWFHEARGPIVGMIVSHSGFQSGARDLAKNHGIVTADTLDLAEIAARSKDLAEDLGAGARAEVCRTRTLNLLSLTTTGAG